MTKETVNKVISECKSFLTPKQLTKLKKVLKSTEEIKTALSETSDNHLTNGELFNLFISSKRVEGCSSRSIKMYRSIISSFIKKTTSSFNELTTDDIRSYINKYEEVNKISKISLHAGGTPCPTPCWRRPCRICWPTPPRWPWPPLPWMRRSCAVSPGSAMRDRLRRGFAGNREKVYGKQQSYPAETLGRTAALFRPPVFRRERREGRLMMLISHKTITSGRKNTILFV